MSTRLFNTFSALASCADRQIDEPTARLTDGRSLDRAPIGLTEGKEDRLENRARAFLVSLALRGVKCEQERAALSRIVKHRAVQFL